MNKVAQPVEWRTIEQEPDYEVSSDGRVRRSSNGRVRNLHPNLSGTLSVKLKETTYLVHRLVALAFIDTEDDTLDVNHRDLDKHNNRVSNLFWAKHQVTMQHTQTFEKLCKKVGIHRDVASSMVQGIVNGDLTMAECARDHNVSHARMMYFVKRAKSELGI